MATKRKASRREWGKVRKLPSGRLQASYVGPDGERYPAPLTFDTLTDAKAWLAGVRGDIAAERWTSPREVAAVKVERAQTLSEYAEAWLASRTNSRGDALKPRTVDEYRRLLRVPDKSKDSDTGGPLADLAPLPLVALTPKRVRDWRAAQLATGKKTQTSRAYGLLNAIMTTAVGDRLVETNPCAVKGGGSTHTGRKVVPPTDGELDHILAAITPKYRALVIVAAVGGLRYGEATALRAKDVLIERDGDGNVLAAEITVERGAVRVSGVITAGATKSEAGVRSVAIFHQHATFIADHIAGKVEGASRIIGDALLFPAADGVSFLSQSAFWKHWNAARTAAGRPDMPFHALRHYAGTRYAQAGASLKETMARLGHSSMGAAMRYQHAGNRDRELAARMSRRSTSA